MNRILTTTLAAVLRADLIKASSPVPGVGDGIDQWSACSGELVVRFVRNDYLYLNTTRLAHDACFNQQGVKAECYVFTEDETLEQFDTLVVNNGAHPRTDEEFDPAMRTAAKMLSSSMKRIHGKDALLIVRNTAPGHWGCTDRWEAGKRGRQLSVLCVTSAGTPPSIFDDPFLTTSFLVLPKYERSGYYPLALVYLYACADSLMAPSTRKLLKSLSRRRPVSTCGAMSTPR